MLSRASRAVAMRSSYVLLVACLHCMPAATVYGRSLIWTGPLSGTQQFTNCKNWNNGTIAACQPSSGDSVTVPPGANLTLQWSISTDITMSSLTIGQSGSTTFELQLEKTGGPDVNITVTGTAAIHCTRLNFEYQPADGGADTSSIHFLVKNLDWTGQHILASSSFTTKPQILVAGNLTVAGGAVPVSVTRTLSDVTVYIAGYASWGGGITKLRFKDGAQLRVMPNATLENFVDRWILGGKDIEVGHVQFVCDGICRFSCAQTCSHTIDILTTNRMEFVPANLTAGITAALPSVTLSGTLANTGTMAAYFINVNVDMRRDVHGQLGSWSAFGPPLLSTSYSFASASTTLWWVDISGSAQEYDFTRRMTIGAGNRGFLLNATFAALVSRGPVVWEVTSLLGAAVSVTTSVSIDHHGTLQLVGGQSGGTQAFVLQPQAEFSAGYLFVDQYWQLELASEANALVARQCAVGPGAVLRVPSNSSSSAPAITSLTFSSQLYLLQASPTTPSLSVSSANVTCGDVVLNSTTSGGGIYLSGGASMEVTGSLTWNGGKIEGKKSTVKLRRGAVLSTAKPKSLSNATLEIEGNVPTSISGCIVEYFQYRPQASPAYSLVSVLGFYKAGANDSQYRLPASFDDPTSASDYSTLERTCSHGLQAYGRAPVVFGGDGQREDADRLTFTHTYAVRQTARFHKAVAGDCALSLAWSYGVVRLWVDGVVRALFCADGSRAVVDTCNTSVLASATANVTLALAIAQHQVRIDVVRLPPTATPGAGYAPAYKLTSAVTYPAGGTTLVLGDRSSLWSCQTDGVDVIRFYPQTSFGIRFPENVCQTRATTAELCGVGLGVSCVKLAGASLTLGTASSVVVQPTGVLWLDGSTSKLIGTSDAGDGVSSLQQHGLVLYSDRVGSVFKNVQIDRFPGSCVSANETAPLAAIEFNDTIVRQGRCRRGAYEHNGRCYFNQVSGGEVRNGYSAVQAACRCRGGFLASITDSATATFINRLLQQTHSSLRGTPPLSTYYVGLRELGCSIGITPRRYTQLQWDDRACPTELPLDLAESAPQCQHCVVLEKNFSSSSNGTVRFLQRGCGESSHRYICEEPLYSDLGTLPLKNCSNVTCSPGWLHYNDHCYRLRTTGQPNITFDAAAAECFRAGAELISVNDYAEQVGIAPLLSGTTTVVDYWIGLYVQPQANLLSAFQWLDATPAFFRAWACTDTAQTAVSAAWRALMPGGSTSWRGWTPVAPAPPTPVASSYICEMRPPVRGASFFPPRLVQGSCVADWLQYQQKCYYFSPTPMSWHEALAACQKRQASSLVEIFDRSTLAVLQSHVLRRPPTGLANAACTWWIGLRRDSTTGGAFRWVSGASSAFLDWACMAVPPQDGTYMCAVMQSCLTGFNNGWVARRCDTVPRLPSICEYSLGANQSSVSTTASSISSLPQTTPSSTSMMTSSAAPTTPAVTQPPSTTTLPATTLPATTLPATTTPATTLPATTLPATTLPATTLPATTLPATTLPATTTPATTLPATTLPATTLPATTLPATTTPATTLPATTLPATTTPATTLPATTLPATTLPATTTPATTLPATTLPATTLPATTTPATTRPATTTPIVTPATTSAAPLTNSATPTATLPIATSPVAIVTSPVALTATSVTVATSAASTTAIASQPPTTSQAGPITSSPRATGQTGPITSSPPVTGQTGPITSSPPVSGQTGPITSSPPVTGQTGPVTDSPPVTGQTGPITNSPPVTGQTGSISSSPPGTGQTGPIASSPPATGQTGPITSSPPVTGQTGPITSSPPVTGQPGSITSSPPATGQTGPITNSPPVTGQTGPITSSSPATGQTGPITSSPPVTGQTGSITSSPPGTGQTGPITSSPPATGQTGSITNSPPVTGQTGPITSLRPVTGQTGPITSSPPGTGQTGPMPSTLPTISQTGTTSDIAATTVGGSDSPGVSLAVLVPSVAGGVLLMLGIVILTACHIHRRKVRSLTLHADVKTPASTTIHNPTFRPNEARAYAPDDGADSAPRYTATGAGNGQSEYYKHIDSSMRDNQDYQSLTTSGAKLAPSNGMYQPVLGTAGSQYQSLQRRQAQGDYAVSGHVQGDYEVHGNETGHEHEQGYQAPAVARPESTTSRDTHQRALQPSSPAYQALLPRPQQQQDQDYQLPADSMRAPSKDSSRHQQQGDQDYQMPVDSKRVSSKAPKGSNQHRDTSGQADDSDPDYYDSTLEETSYG